MDAKNEVVLGGRVFVPTEEDDMTFDQFSWIQTASEKAGLGTEMMEIVEPMLQRVVEEEKEISDREARNLTMKIVNRCYEARAHLDVLVGLIVEKGSEWSFETAEANKAFFGKLKGKDEIAKVNAVLGEAIVGFFYSGLASTEIFQSFSQNPDLEIRVREAFQNEPDQEEDLAISGL